MIQLAFTLFEYVDQLIVRDATLDFVPSRLDFFVGIGEAHQESVDTVVDIDTGCVQLPLDIGGAIIRFDHNFVFLGGIPDRMIHLIAADSQSHYQHHNKGDNYFRYQSATHKELDQIHQRQQ